MTTLPGDILDIVSTNGGVLVHQVNCRRVAGAGLALQIRRRWPEWYHAYRCTIPQLGRAWVFRAAPYVWIASLYAQRDIGRNVPQTDYTALRKRMQGASHAATTQAGLFEEEVRG